MSIKISPNPYLTETILLGGLPTTRAQIIRDYQEQGTPQIYIDRLLQGIDLNQSIQQRKLYEH